MRETRPAAAGMDRVALTNDTEPQEPEAAVNVDLRDEATASASVGGERARSSRTAASKAPAGERGCLGKSAVFTGKEQLGIHA